MNYAEAKIAGHGNIGKRKPKKHLINEYVPYDGIRRTWCGLKVTRVADAVDRIDIEDLVTCGSCRGAYPGTKFGGA